MKGNRECRRPEDCSRCTGPCPHEIGDNEYLVDVTEAAVEFDGDDEYVDEDETSDLADLTTDDNVGEMDDES